MGWGGRFGVRIFLTVGDSGSRRFSESVPFSVMRERLCDLACHWLRNYPTLVLYPNMPYPAVSRLRRLGGLARLPPFPGGDPVPAEHQGSAVPVRYFYVDESYNETLFCLSALAIRHTDWKQCFDAIRAHRVGLRNRFGIRLRREIHAGDFLAGRGDLGPQVVGKHQRASIFLGLLQLVEKLPGAMLFNVCLPRHGCADPQMLAWDRLVNRIERTMLKMEQVEHPKRANLLAKIGRSLSSTELDELRKRVMNYRARATIIADEGREGEIEKALRRMHVFNPVPSQYEEWAPGQRTKNITVDRIIEDPVFKESHRSYFLQLVDCVAYALLKRETPPTPRIRRYRIHQMFDRTVAHICFKHATKYDPLGIVRQ